MKSVFFLGPLSPSQMHWRLAFGYFVAFVQLPVVRVPLLPTPKGACQTITCGMGRGWGFCPSVSRGLDGTFFAYTGRRERSNGRFSPFETIHSFGHCHGPGFQLMRCSTSSSSPSPESTPSWLGHGPHPWTPEPPPPLRKHPLCGSTERSAWGCHVS